MSFSLLKSLAFRMLPGQTVDINKSSENYYTKFVNASSQMASRSYTILKTWAIITSLLCVFSFFSIVLYLSLFYSIMPVTVQESILSVHKNHNAMVGMTSSNVVLEKEKYKIYLKLNLPEDETNYDIGNFQTSLSFVYKYNKALTLQNMGIMKYYSPTIRIIRSLIRAPLIILNLIDESQDILIEYSHSIENPDEISDVKVYISPANLRVNSISMVFEVQLSGLRLFMQNNSALSFFIGTTLIFILLLGSFFILFSINLQIFTISKTEMPETTEKPEKTENSTKVSTVEKGPCDFSKILKTPGTQTNGWFKKLIKIN